MSLTPGSRPGSAGATLAEATQLHLFLSIVVLMLLTRFFGVAPEGLDVALFSCVSMPATYALTYYHARVYRAGRFVTRRTEPARAWLYETVALLMSFAMGYTVFVALSGTADPITFTAAFVTVQAMRLATILAASTLRGWGIDIQHPAVVMLVSAAAAALGMVCLGLVSLFLPIV